jgi:hypothetical protein
MVLLVLIHLLSFVALRRNVGDVRQMHLTNTDDLPDIQSCLDHDGSSTTVREAILYFGLTR